MAKGKVTGLKKDAKFDGVLQHRFFVEGLTAEQADTLQSELAEALAPVLVKYGKFKFNCRTSRRLECEKGHGFMDTENYCVTCNIINEGKTAGAYLRSKGK